MNPSQIINTILALTALAVLVGGGLIGYGWRGAMCGEQVAKLEASQAQRERAAAQRVIAEYERIQRENEAIELAWITTQREIEARHAELKNELPAVMPAHQRTDGACNLSRGAVRVLNRAAGHPDPVPAPAGGTVGEAQAASTVTEQAFVEHCRAWGEQYERVAGQLTQLIDWHRAMNQGDDDGR
ncbi:MAG: hypothetical protein ACOZAP_04700 [Pseudomonadota bacterium]